MSRSFVTLLLLLGVALSAGADEPKKKKRAEDHFFARRLRVSLRNGSHIMGILRTRTLYERLRGGLFDAVDIDRLRNEHEAAKDRALREKKPMPADPFTAIGIRLWFVMGNEGYVFLLQKDIQSYKLEETLKEQEFKKIMREAEERAALRRKAREEREKREAEEAARKQKEGAKEGEGAKPTSSEELKVPEGFTEEQWIARAKELLEKFPESDGWGKDKKSYDWLKFKYQRTKGGTTTQTIVVNGKTRTVRTKRGIPRTKEEDEFFKGYALWTEAGKWRKAGKLGDQKSQPTGPPAIKKPPVPAEQPKK